MVVFETDAGGADSRQVECLVEGTDGPLSIDGDGVFRGASQGGGFGQAVDDGAYRDDEEVVEVGGSRVVAQSVPDDDFDRSVDEAVAVDLGDEVDFLGRGLRQWGEFPRIFERVVAGVPKLDDGGLVIGQNRGHGAHKDAAPGGDEVVGLVENFPSGEGLGAPAEGLDLVVGLGLDLAGQGVPQQVVVAVDRAVEGAGLSLMDEFVVESEPSSGDGGRDLAAGRGHSEGRPRAGG